MYSFVPFTEPDTTVVTVTDQIPKICLNMIVKNESKIILRLLNSIYTLIDGYCICDTGSTDDTVEMIETFSNIVKFLGKSFINRFAILAIIGHLP